MSGHTKEPWLLSDLTVYTLRRVKWAGVETFENAWSATVQPDGQHKTPVKELEANARRIVECVNALAGYNPAALAALVEAAEKVNAGFKVQGGVYGDQPNVLKTEYPPISAFAELAAALTAFREGSAS